MATTINCLKFRLQCSFALVPRLTLEVARELWRPASSNPGCLHHLLLSWLIWRSNYLLSVVKPNDLYSWVHRHLFLYSKTSCEFFTNIKFISMIMDAVQMRFVHLNVIRISSDVTLRPPHTLPPVLSRFFIWLYSINNACTCTFFKITLIVITKLQEAVCTVHLSLLFKLF